MDDTKAICGVLTEFSANSQIKTLNGANTGVL